MGTHQAEQLYSVPCFHCIVVLLNKLIIESKDVGLCRNLSQKKINNLMFIWHKQQRDVNVMCIAEPGGTGI